MRRALFVLLALAAAPLGAQAPAPERPAPEIKDCVMSGRVQEQRVVDDHTVYFREGSRWYRNDLPRSCAGLDSEKSLASRTPTDRLCSGDPVTVFERGSSFVYGACPLGKFTRTDAPPLPHRRPNR